VWRKSERPFCSLEKFRRVLLPVIEICQRPLGQIHAIYFGGFLIICFRTAGIPLPHLSVNTQTNPCLRLKWIQRKSLPQQLRRRLWQRRIELQKEIGTKRDELNGAPDGFRIGTL